MGTDNLIEFQTLSILLSDTVVCKRLMNEHPKTFNIMLRKYSFLVDKIVKQYELPSLNKGLLTD